MGRTVSLPSSLLVLGVSLLLLHLSLALVSPNGCYRPRGAHLPAVRSRHHRLVRPYLLRHRRPGARSLYARKSTALQSNNHEEVDGLSMAENEAKTSALVSLFAFIGQSTSLFVSATFFSVLAWQRSPFMVAFFMGAIANAILSKVLKRLLDQSRPTNSNSGNSVDLSDNGMPSSHAMSLGFIATVTTSAAMGTSSSFPVVALLLASYTATSLTYRVYARYHTTAQVVVGLVGGCTNGWIFAHYGRWVLVDWLQTHAVLLFPANATSFAVPWLIVPILLGAATVGSIERRLPKILRAIRKES